MDHKEHEAVTHRSEKEKEQIINRLKRIEGQVRGIQNMIENDRYCVDILVQISAINAAMKSRNGCIKTIQVIVFQVLLKMEMVTKQLKN